MNNLYYRIQIAQDFCMAHFKRDVPCFQFSGFQPADRAGVMELRELLNGIMVTADWADEQTKTMSDHYPAQHHLQLPRMASTPFGVIFSRDGSTIRVRNGVAIVPPVWYQSGQVQWGAFEAGVREAIRRLGG